METGENGEQNKPYCYKQNLSESISSVLAKTYKSGVQTIGHLAACVK